METDMLRKLDTSEEDDKFVTSREKFGSTGTKSAAKRNIVDRLLLVQNVKETRLLFFETLCC